MKTLLFLLTIWLILGLVQCTKNSQANRVQATSKKLESKRKPTPAATIYELAVKAVRNTLFPVKATTTATPALLII